jgi:hypothetical protein
MRSKLQQSEGSRKMFYATFSRLGKKQNYHGYSEDTILLTNVIDAETGMQVTNHLWFSYSKAFEKVTLTEGVVIEFEARVKAYKKGYVNPKLGLKSRSTDFKLSHPTKIRLRS